MKIKHIPRIIICYFKNRNKPENRRHLPWKSPLPVPYRTDTEDTIQIDFNYPTVCTYCLTRLLVVVKKS